MGGQRRSKGGVVLKWTGCVVCIVGWEMVGPKLKQKGGL